MKKYPYLYLVIGFAFLIIPTVVYLIFLIPEMSEEYNVLMTSGGVLGAFGYYGAEKIPESLKYSGIVKTASRSYTTVIISLLVREFLSQIIGLIAVIVTSVIIYIIFREVYKNARRKLENKELAGEISRSLNKDIK